MNDFSINPNFQVSNFNNSINDFNKVFNNSLHETNKAFSDSDKSFQEIFNSVGSNKPIEASIEYQEPKKISATEEMATNIGKGFRNSLEELNNLQRDSERKTELFAAGGDVSVHDVMIASEKSALAMQMAVQLRNRMISAYNELKNMSV